MCYTIDGLFKKQIRHAQRKGAPTDAINALIDQYNNLSESGDAMPGGAPQREWFRTSAAAGYGIAHQPTQSIAYTMGLGATLLCRYAYSSQACQPMP